MASSRPGPRRPSPGDGEDQGGAGASARRLPEDGPAGDEVLRSVLARRRWALVGCSPDPRRPSHEVGTFLAQRGYRVVPVTPVAPEVLGEQAWPTLAAVPEPVEVVEVFRARPGPHVEEAIAAGVSAVWLPLGVIDESAAARARAAGLDVVMDRCPVIESSRLGLGPLASGPAVEG